MWGYYTGNGSGLCLVVDVDPSDIHPVQYVGKREKLTHSSRFPEPSDGNFRAFSATKSFHWSHEKEHRFFVNFDRDDLDINEIGPMKFLKMKVDLAGS
jgi:hypothetical protein